MMPSGEANITMFESQMALMVPGRANWMTRTKQTRIRTSARIVWRLRMDKAPPMPDPEASDAWRSGNDLSAIRRGQAANHHNRDDQDTLDDLTEIGVDVEEDQVRGDQRQYEWQRGQARPARRGRRRDDAPNNHGRQTAQRVVDAGQRSADAGRHCQGKATDGAEETRKNIGGDARALDRDSAAESSVAVAADRIEAQAKLRSNRGVQIIAIDAARRMSPFGSQVENSRASAEIEKFLRRPAAGLFENEKRDSAPDEAARQSGDHVRDARKDDDQAVHGAHCGARKKNDNGEEQGLAEGRVLHRPRRKHVCDCDHGPDGKVNTAGDHDHGLGSSREGQRQGPHCKRLQIEMEKLGGYRP